MTVCPNESDALVPASRWLAGRLLGFFAAVRRFNGDQVAVRERWLARHGVPARR